MLSLSCWRVSLADALSFHLQSPSPPPVSFIEVIKSRNQNGQSPFTARSSYVTRFWTGGCGQLPWGDIFLSWLKGASPPPFLSPLPFTCACFLLSPMNLQSAGRGSKPMLWGWWSVRKWILVSDDINEELNQHKQYFPLICIEGGILFLLSYS